MKKVFVTFLATDSFLPGVQALNQSLKNFKNTNYPLIIMVSENVSVKVVKLLKKQSFNVQIVKEIKSPYLFKNDYRNFRCMFTKLRIFELSCFDKIVYIDADMIVCENIECLFEKQHMSAVIAGSILPVNSTWKDLNAGLLVVEPNIDLFNKMYESINLLLSKDGSDQGFLHEFFPDWKNETQLHLEHKFNIPGCYLDDYCKGFDFKFEFIDGMLSTRNISIIHFWGIPKPWEISKKNQDFNLSKKRQSELYWFTIYKQATH